MKAKLLVTLVAAASVSSLNFLTDKAVPALPFEATAFAQSQAAGGSQLSEVAFKNIQVMKGMQVDEFMGAMGLFSAALSSCCGDCHTGAGTSNPDWADDPPRKKIARRMVQMVNNINKDNFGGRQQVTCWTCHHGDPNPAVTPSINTIYNVPAPTPPDVLPVADPGTSATLPAEQILDRYIQALGGAERLAKITSFTAAGESHLFDEVRTDPAEVYAKAPNKMATIVHQRGGDLARTFDGRDAWVMLPLTVVGEYPLNGSAREGAKLDAQMAFPGGLKQFFTSWRVSYPATVGGRPVNVLQGSGASGLIATFYFDKQTGLLTRMIRYATTSLGRVPTQTDYSDYRAVDGVMIPFHYTFAWVSGQEEYTLKEVKLNVPVDDAKFAKPVQRVN